MLKTFTPKLTDITNDWIIIDATGLTLGRLSTEIATRLMGKHKPSFAPHMDCGDNVVVINAAKVLLTGNKVLDKKYYRHSGYPGGISEINVSDQLIKHPTRVLEHAVAGMLPKNRLHDVRMKRLRLYAMGEHGHDGQKPTELNILPTARQGEKN